MKKTAAVAGMRSTLAAEAAKLTMEATKVSSLFLSSRQMKHLIIDVRAAEESQYIFFRFSNGVRAPNLGGFHI